MPHWYVVSHEYLPITTVSIIIYNYCTVNDSVAITLLTVIISRTYRPVHNLVRLRPCWRCVSELT